MTVKAPPADRPAAALPQTRPSDAHTRNWPATRCSSRRRPCCRRRCLRRRQQLRKQGEQLRNLQRTDSLRAGDLLNCRRQRQGQQLRLRQRRRGYVGRRRRRGTGEGHPERQARSDPGRRRRPEPVPVREGQGQHKQLLQRLAKVWPPFISSGAATGGTGATSSLLGTTSRTDGTKQVTYHGHPPYYYVSDDHTSGSTTGEGPNQFGAEWYVLSPTGSKVEKGGS